MGSRRIRPAPGARWWAGHRHILAVVVVRVSHTIMVGWASTCWPMRQCKALVVADAGMQSVRNLNAIKDARFSFIVGSRLTTARYDLAEHFQRHRARFDDGQILESARTMGQGTSNPKSPQRPRLPQHNTWEKEMGNSAVRQ